MGKPIDITRVTVTDVSGRTYLAELDHDGIPHAFAWDPDIFRQVVDRRAELGLKAFPPWVGRDPIADDELPGGIE